VQVFDLRNVSSRINGKNVRVLGISIPMREYVPLVKEVYGSDRLISLVA